MLRSSKSEEAEDNEEQEAHALIESNRICLEANISAKQ